jgi:anaerobic selenocysteine-containing dehydrogenase
MGEIKKIKTACRACHGGCGVIVTVENAVVTKIEPDKDSPISRGRLCPKALAGIELLYHPDRLKYPMKRIGKRGEGKWERISWDAAYDIIVKNINKIRDNYGIESLAVAQGTGRHHLKYVIRFTNTLGTPNWFEPGTAQCFVPRITAGMVTYGFHPVVDYYSEVNPECIVVWGSHPGNSGADCESMFRFKDAVRKGSKLIVIDPRKIDIADKAELYLQIRPGTDDALALGMMNIIINEDLYDKEFVEKWCYGFKELKERVQEYPLERVAKITGIPGEKIIAAARMMATTKPTTLEWGCALEHTPNTMQTVRAVALLPALTGNIDVKGGFIEGMHLLPDPDKQLDKLPMKQKLQRLGIDNFKFLCGAHKPSPSAHIPTVFEAIDTGKPYPIKGLMLCGNNGLLSIADSKKTYKSLMGLDFICSQELFMTPTTQLADVVLPVGCWLEVDALLSAPTIADHVALVQKKIVRTHECKSDEEIFIELSQRLGLDYGDSLDDMFEYQLDSVRERFPQYQDLTIEKLRELNYIEVPIEYKQYEKNNRGFNTPTGKVELYSTIMEEFGYDPLPFYQEPPESPYSNPELAKEYPLILNTGGRSLFFFLSENRQMKSLRKHHPYPQVEIHPETAAQYGISDGDWVYIESPRGRITQKALVTENIAPNSINCQYGWWFPEKKDSPNFGAFEANANVLTSRDAPYDPSLGTYQLRALLCKIYKNEDQTDADFDPNKA